MINIKYILTSLILVFGLFGCNSKTPSTNTHSMQTLVTLSDLSPQQYSEWKKIKNEWLSSYFFPCLEKFQLKQDCKMCGDIVWNVQFNVGNDGQISSFEILDRIIDCFDINEEKIEAFQKCNEENISEFVFNNAFANMSLQVEVGRRTKC